MPSQFDYTEEWTQLDYTKDLGSCSFLPPPAPDFVRAYHMTSVPHALSDIKRRRLKVARFSEVNDPFELLGLMGVFPLLKSLLPVVVAFLLPTTDTLDHRRVGNGTHRHGLFQEPMEELPAMA